MIEAYAERWALITGASSGIGAEFARKLAARGMHLVLTARSRDALESLARDLDTRHGTRTEIICADLTLPDDVERVKSEVKARQIEVELLVNNAGFGIAGDIESTDADRILQMVRLNIETLTDLTYHFLPAMLERRHGAIVNVASIAGFQPVAYMGAYSASKSYVLHFSEALWAEARDRGVTVMALCPGATETSFFDVAGVPNWLKKHSSQTAGQVVKSALKGLEKRRSYWVTGLVELLAMPTRADSPARDGRQTIDGLLPAATESCGRGGPFHQAPTRGRRGPAPSRTQPRPENGLSRDGSFPSRFTK